MKPNSQFLEALEAAKPTIVLRIAVQEGLTPETACLVFGKTEAEVLRWLVEKIGVPKTTPHSTKRKMQVFEWKLSEKLPITFDVYYQGTALPRMTGTTCKTGASRVSFSSMHIPRPFGELVLNLRKHPHWKLQIEKPALEA